MAEDGVASLLREWGLEEFIPKFHEERIRSLEIMLDLTTEDLEKYLGMRLGDRKIFLSKAKEVKTQMLAEHPQPAPLLRSEPSPSSSSSSYFLSSSCTCGRHHACPAPGACSCAQSSSCGWSECQTGTLCSLPSCTLCHFQLSQPSQLSQLTLFDFNPADQSTVPSLFSNQDEPTGLELPECVSELLSSLGETSHHPPPHLVMEPSNNLVCEFIIASKGPNKEKAKKAVLFLVSFDSHATPHYILWRSNAPYSEHDLSQKPARGWGKRDRVVINPTLSYLQLVRFQARVVVNESYNKCLWITNDGAHFLLFYPSQCTPIAASSVQSSPVFNPPDSSNTLMPLPKIVNELLNQVGAPRVTTVPSGPSDLDLERFVKTPKVTESFVRALTHDERTDVSTGSYILRRANGLFKTIKFDQKPKGGWGAIAFPELGGVLLRKLIRYENRKIIEQLFHKCLWAALNDAHTLLFYPATWSVSKRSRHLVRELFPSKKQRTQQRTRQLNSGSEDSTSDDDEEDDEADSDHSDLNDDHLRDDDQDDNDDTDNSNNIGNNDDGFDNGNDSGNNFDWNGYDDDMDGNGGNFDDFDDSVNNFDQMLGHEFCGCVPEHLAQSLAGRCVSLVPQNIDGKHRLVVVVGARLNAIVKLVVASASQEWHVCNPWGAASKLPSIAAPPGHCWMKVIAAVLGTTLVRVVNPEALNDECTSDERYVVKACTGDTEANRCGLFEVVLTKQRTSQHLGVVHKSDPGLDPSHPDIKDPAQFVSVKILPSFCHQDRSGPSSSSSSDDLQLVDDVHLAAQAFELHLFTLLRRYLPRTPMNVVELMEETLLAMAFERLFQLAQRHRNPEFIEILQMCTNDLERCLVQQNDLGRSLLSLAASAGDVNMVQLLCSIARFYTAKITRVLDNDGRSPMHLAAKKGHESIISKLNTFDGMLVDLPDGLHMTPLHYAAQEGHESAIRALVGRGSEGIDSTATGGRTAVMLAAMSGHVEVVKVLIKLGSRAIDQPADDGRTPMHEAAERGHVSVINVLIEKGSEALDKVDRQGNTPMHLAVGRGAVDVVGALIRLGNAAVNVRNFDGRTPLTVAIDNNNAEMANQLIAANADVLIALSSCTSNEAQTRARSETSSSSANTHQQVNSCTCGRHHACPALGACSCSQSLSCGWSECQTGALCSLPSCTLCHFQLPQLPQLPQLTLDLNPADQSNVPSLFSNQDEPTGLERPLLPARSTPGSSCASQSRMHWDQRQKNTMAFQMKYWDARSSPGGYGAPRGATALVVGPTERELSFQVGSRSTVPENPCSKLSYYLNCINGLGEPFTDLFSDVPSLLQYTRTYWSQEEQRVLFVLAGKLDPSVLSRTGVLMLVSDGHPILKGSANTFVEVDVKTKQSLALASDELVAIVGRERVTKITKIMACQESWLQNNWLNPMKSLAATLSRPAPPPVKSKKCAIQ